MADTITRRSNNSTSTKDSTVTRTRTDYNAQNIRDTSNSNSDSESQEMDEYEQMGGGDQEQPVKYRIGWVISLMLLVVAGYLDLIELVLDAAGTIAVGAGVVVGYIKDAFTLVIFPAIFFLLGVPFWKGKKAKKKMTAMATSFLISILPWVGAVMPETLIGIAVTIYLTRAEDREKAGVGESAVSKSITRARRGR